jgi:hypothetical protein
MTTLARPCDHVMLVRVTNFLCCGVVNYFAGYVFIVHLHLSATAPSSALLCFPSLLKQEISLAARLLLAFAPAAVANPYIS